MRLENVVKDGRGLFCVLALAASVPAARGQAPPWLSFTNDPSRIVADPSVINDAPCDPNCSGVCGPTNQCACACEKDMAVADLDRDGTGPGKDQDLIIVRILPFMLGEDVGGGVSNLLFMNENGAMVDRTATLAPCFADETQDRDVAIVDVDFDFLSGNNFDDVVIASTFGEQPRVYMNLGNDGAGNWRGLCLCYDKETDTCHDASYLAAHSACFVSENDNCFVNIPALADDRRIAPFSPGPRFCSVAAGDVDGDGCRDLYFVDYDNNLEDRLLSNTKVGSTCTGFFTDVTAARLCPNGSPCFNESAFGTGAQIIDMNLDGFNDIVKADGDTNPDEQFNNGNLVILYNDPNNVGHFNLRQELNQEVGFGELDQSYMFRAVDLNQDLGIDLYVVKANRDSFVLNKCTDPLSEDCHRPSDGAVQLVYPGGNVHTVDLNGDTFPDATVADLDVTGNSSTFRELRITRTKVNAQDPMDVVVFDASCPGGTCDRCMWNTIHTFDFAWLDVNGDLKLDLWSGHGAGNNLFLWEVPATATATARRTDAPAIRYKTRSPSAAFPPERASIVSKHVVLQKAADGSVAPEAPAKRAPFARS